jgi:transcriptional regulator with XRE-family HTH domain
MSTVNLIKGRRMLTLEQIKERLGDKNLSEVARRVGLTGAYLSAIVRGVKVNPSYETVKKLSDYLNGDTHDE